MEAFAGLLILLCLTFPAGSTKEPDWLGLVTKFNSDFVNCGDKGLCKLRHPLNNSSSDWNTTSVLGPNQMKGTAFLSSICNCDEECVEYGDCCKDAAVKYGGQDGQGDPWACLPLITKDTLSQQDEAYHIYMIAKCPANFAAGSSVDVSLVAMCQRDLEFHYSYLMDIPVLSLKSNLTYANIYCARCHADDQHLAQWNKTSLRCNEQYELHNVSRQEMFSSANYKPGTRYWVLETSDSKIIECAVVIDQLQNFSKYLRVTDSRKCYPRIDRCADDWPDLMDQATCSFYSLFVVDNSSKVYKNPHCAMCNHVPLEETVCFEYPWKNARIGPPIADPRKSFSFSMIIDFGFGGEGEFDRVGQKKRCQKNEIFDHLHDRCHAVMCGANFVNQDGLCVPKKELIAHSDWPNPQAYLNSSCQRIVLIESHDYYVLENDSIVVNKTGQLLDPDQYEQLTNENGTESVQICANQTLQDYYFKYSSGQRFLSDICLAISIVCLAIHIGIHLILPKLRNLPGKNLLSLSCALFLAQLLFLTAIGARMELGYELCAALAVLTHWSYLAAFFWMNVMGFDICRTFAGQMMAHHSRGPGRGQRNTFRLYSLYAWGFPTLIVIIGLVLDFTHILDEYAPQYGGHVCWISNRSGLSIFFGIPMAALLLENLILFTITVVSILKQRRAAQYAVDQSYRSTDAADMASKTAALERLQQDGGLHQQENETDTPPKRTNSAKKTKKKQKVRFILYIKLGLIMGLGWIFAFAAALAKIPVLWYPFILFNALQGAYIFIAFDCKRKIYFMLYYWATKHPHPADSSASSRGYLSSNTKLVSNRRISTQTTTSEGLRRSTNNLEVRINPQRNSSSAAPMRSSSAVDNRQSFPGYRD